MVTGLGRAAVVPWIWIVYVCDEGGVLLPPPPPQAINAKRIPPSNVSQRPRRLRIFLPRRKTPASGMKAKQSCGVSERWTGFCNDAEVAGTFTARVNGTALLLGVIVGGEKAQDAPGGKELCKQESVIGWLRLPVFAFKESE